MRTRMFAALLAVLGIAATAPAAACARLIADWAGTPGSGQVLLDAGGGGHDGRLGATNSEDSADPAWIAGPSGHGALRFAGGQYVAVPDSAALEPAHPTVEAWVRAARTPGKWRYVLSEGSLKCTRAAFGLYSGWTGGLAFYVSSETRFTLSPEAPARVVWDGAWHRVTGMFDGARTRLFVDGAQVGEGTATPAPIAYGVGGKGVYIGTYRGSCERPFIGDIGPVSILDDGPEPPPPPAGPPVIEPVPGTPTSLPVPAGAPAPHPAIQVPVTHRCMTIAVRHRSLRARHRAGLRVSVRRDRRGIAGARVVARGAGVRISARTDRAGIAGLRVRPLRSGRLTIRVGGQRRSCGIVRLRVG